MDPFAERLDRARQRLQKRQIKPAVKLLQAILRENPDHIESLDLLAKLALRQQNFDSARQLLERAINIWPRSSRLHSNLGRAHHGLGDYEIAIAKYKQALSQNNYDGLIHYNLGVSQKAAGLLNDAGHSFQKAIGLLPAFIPAYYNLANTLAESGMINASVGFYQKALELAPARDDICVDLGNVLRRCDNDDAAIDCFRRALEINPESVGALNNLSNALRDRGESHQAEELIRKAITIQPRNPILHNGLGLVLEQLGQVSQAIECYRQALTLKSDYSNAHYNLAGLEQELGNLDVAEKGYSSAMKYGPEKLEPRFRLACLKLLQGDFPAGWPGYELRWKMKEARNKERTFDQPTWNGCPLNGKTILVYAEQGLGDSLQFVRYLKVLQQQGAKVLFQCQPRLTALLSRCEGIDQIVPTHQTELPEFDVQIALLSLPSVLNTTIENIPVATAYLQAHPSKIEQWKERLSHIRGKRIGIAWQGKPKYFRDKFRSIPLAHFKPLAELPNIQLISLQKGPGADQLQPYSKSESFLNLAPEMDLGENGFEDTAAAIKNLDLVITSDTSIAHLAGGLGATTWVALNYVPEWRWLLGREDSPWYPSMRLFRQPTFGDWGSVFSKMKEMLA